jgi:lipoprotein-anchoring transpeptidase ErfK/SrfK
MSVAKLLPMFMFVTAASVVAHPSPSSSTAEISVDGIFTGARSRAALEAQVLLNHSNHSPGVIDAAMGGNTRRAIRAFQRANGMPIDGRLSDALMSKLRAGFSGGVLQRYTITAEDVAGPFVSLPNGMEEQAKLEALGYESPAEGLAEKFYMAQSFIEALNPGADFGRAGTEITVVAPRTKKLQAEVQRIEIDKAASALRAFAADGTIVATYPASIGSDTFPSPNGAMEVRAIAPAPTYHFDPEGREWGPDETLTIAAGPNNPVGGTWIDLTKEGYGIHGTPDPRLIAKTASHGCVRLTNWDAAELAKAVGKGTIVEFV